MYKPDRREFIKTIGAASLAAGTQLYAAEKNAENVPTIQNVIDKIIMECTGKPLENTVDTIKTGDPSQPVKGIAVTFLATAEIIQKAIDMDCNFIITHEPTFYNHEDQTDWLEDEPVYQFKRKLADDNNIVIWRCHDYIHSRRPDGIMEGMVEELGWGEYQSKETPALFTMPAITLKELGEQLKSKYNVPALRSIGDPNLECKKVVFSLGAPGGRSQIMMASKIQPDVLICGEINEWETNIWFKDAIYSGRKQALILLGHRLSEEAGMNSVMKWVTNWYPEVNTQYLSAKAPFQYL